MKKLLLLLNLIVVSSFATDNNITTIENGISLYSEYYPNDSAKFKGTIIFENGSGTTADEWTQNKKFFDCAKKVGSIFLYDRNGLGNSPADLSLSEEKPLTASYASSKLAKLLKQKDLKPPYIIVAHSYGSIYAGKFIADNESQVDGVLLVDPVPKNFHFLADGIMKDYESAIQYAITESAVDVYKKFGGARSEVTYQLLGFEQSKAEIAKSGIIKNNTPVIIISSTSMEKDKPLKEDWYTSQKQWLNDNPRSKIIAVNSSHFIQIDQPLVVCEQLKLLTK
ncbi:MAG: alpha/beta hydrolase [Burkholderiales bacterium]|nr:alpha/beta hydrolase [Burkholderiales bacterium]